MNIPEQLTFLFSHDENTESYQSGLQSGLTWDADWMPGGPYVETFRPSLSEEICKQRLAMVAESRRKYDLWHRGFKTGLEQRMIACPAFAAWFKAGPYPFNHNRFVEAVAA